MKMGGTRRPQQQQQQYRERSNEQKKPYRINRLANKQRILWKQKNNGQAHKKLFC